MIFMKKTIFSVILLCCISFLNATTYNIAPEAVGTASSFVENYPASHALDGKARINGQNEWRSQSTQTFWGQINYPWLELRWKEKRDISRIILYDRPTPDSHVAGVTIHFSDSSKIFVNSIPNNGAPKVVDFEPRNVEWVKIEVTDADGLNVGLSEVEVYSSPENVQDCVGKVNPYIESARGRYFFFVTGSLPFGMISSAPLTRNKNQYGGGYNYNSNEILGFPQIHDWMISGITIMPTTGIVPVNEGEQGWKSTFSHEGEVVRPGYHKLFLDRYNMWVEQTATDRVSMYKYTYCDDEEEANILLNLGGYVSTSTMVGAQVKKQSDRKVTGSVYTTGRLWGGPDKIKVYFTMEFDRPVLAFDTWEGQEYHPDATSLSSNKESTPRNNGMSYHDAPSCGIKARFRANKGESIHVKVSISYVSEENACENMERECNHWDFEKVATQAQAVWNDYLGRIQVKGGSSDQQEKFYTDLWHVLLGRHKIDDINGDYPDYTEGKRSGNHTLNAVFKKRTLPKDEKGSVRFHMYNSDAFWLTQWNLNVLWGLAWPEILDDFAACLVQYAENGGLLPRGPNVGGYSYIMTTCPATNLITSAYQKGMLTKVEPEVAYQKMVENHKGGGMLGSVADVKFYEENGYMPNNAGTTLEAAFQDWALAQMAEKMGKKADAEYYLKRSSGWEKLYHPDLKLIMPKNEKGEWLHNNPLSGHGWIEANAWQATWSVSHGLERLAELMGGKEVLAKQLNYAFEQSRKDDFVFGYGAGYVSYANQPGCSNAHVFNRIGRGDLAQYWVRRVNEQAYGGTTPDRGYGGHDEDQGQMGGVSALMSIGLFSVTGTASQNPVYDITAPVFDEVVITLNPRYYKGKKFTIRTKNNSPQNDRVIKCEFNGNMLKDFMLYHKDFAGGGVLELELSGKESSVEVRGDSSSR